MVYRRARRLLGSHEDAEEATQEVFIRVLRGGGGFEGRASVTTWLYEIATNYCLNQIRNRSRRDELRAERHDPDAGRGAPAEADALVEVRGLLAEADEAQARAAIYVLVDGMSHEEAAELLGVSKRTVGNQIERFRAWAAAREMTAAPEAVDALPQTRRQGSK